MVALAEVRLADLVFWGVANQKANPAIATMVIGIITFLKLIVSLLFIQQHRPSQSLPNSDIPEGSCQYDS